MIIFILMNFIVIASSFLITYRLFKLHDFIDSLMTLFIVYFAQIILSELILGIFSILYLKNVILLNLTILLIIWLVTRDKKYSFNFIRIKSAIFSLLGNRIVILLISLILGFGLVKFFINLVNPPFGWDNLNYHFVFPVEWLKHGNLDTPITVFDDPSPSYYPINGSLFFLWLMLPLKNVYLADLGQIPFFILAFLAVYSLGRKLNLDEKKSFFAASLFTLIPNYFKQIQIAYVDVMVASLFLVALNFLFILENNFSFKNTLIYSLAMGLLLGTKTIALAYMALLFIPFIYLSFKNIKKSYVSLMLYMLVIVAFGGFSYIRNFIDTSNPLYPLDFKLFGKVIFKGVMDMATYRAHFHLSDYRLTKLLFHEGLGAQTTLLVLPFIFLALPIAFIKKRKELDFNSAYFLILPIMIYLVYRYLIPLANARYIYNLLGIGILCGFYALAVLNIPERLLGALVVICALSSMPELAKKQELIAAIGLTICLLYLLPRLIKRPRFIILLIILIVGCSMMLEKYYTKNEFPRYIKMVKYSGFWPDATKAWAWLNQNTSGNNIAYAGRPVPFPLYGTNFKNNVYYVSVNKTEPAKLHYFPNSYYHWDDNFLNLHRNLEANGNYRSGADYSVWWDNLLKRNTDYLFIYSLHQTKDIEFPLEDKWAKANPSKFLPVYTNTIAHIYKIIKDISYACLTAQAGVSYVLIKNEAFGYCPGTQ